VRTWRDAGYPHEAYPAIAEILGHAVEGDGPAAPLRYLRAAQLRALETYWFLRLVEGTPRVAALYERLFATNRERMEAFGIHRPALMDVVLDEGYGTDEVTIDPASGEPVAVRITDMLGEEILVVESR
jgi:type III restriction enzyme